MAADGCATEVTTRAFGATEARVATTSLARAITEPDILALGEAYVGLLRGAPTPLVIYIRDDTHLHETQPLSMQACVSIVRTMLDAALDQYAHLAAIVVHVVRLDDLARAVANLFLSMYTLRVPLHITDDGADARAFLERAFLERAAQPPS